MQSPSMSGLNVKHEYRRVLIKLSGEALGGHQGYGLDAHFIRQFASDIGAIHKSGLEICIVVGGGNIFRGVQGASIGIDRPTADYMGMLATIMNALALQSALSEMNILSCVQSAIPMETVCESYVRRQAMERLKQNHVVIFAGGTGNPFFTTDTAAVLRASEMGCDLLMKGTKVDGVYSADPFKDHQAQHFPYLTYEDILTRKLEVMDMTAIALARENSLPIVVFSVLGDKNISKALSGDVKSTFIR